MTTEEKAILLAKAADSKKAREIVLLNLEGLTVMTDYFLICTGTSNTHVRTIVDAVVQLMKQEGMGGIRVEGYEAAVWVLADYGDVVVHVMQQEQRDYYGLETYWKDAVSVPLDFSEETDKQPVAAASE